METFRNPIDQMRSKFQENKNFLRTIFEEIFTIIDNNKTNIIFILLFLLTPVTYELLDFIPGFSDRDNYLKATKSYIVLNDYLTVFAQQVLGTTQSLFGIFSAYFYTFGFISLSSIAFVMLILTVFFRKKEYRRREPFIYISILITMVLIDIGAYFIIPTAPPVRLYPNLFFRDVILPAGDSLITIKYNSVPSGHIYALAIPYLVAKAENYKNWKNLFGGGVVLTSWVILFTGDHYSLDIFSAFFLSFLLFTIFTVIYDYFCSNSVNMTKRMFIQRLKNALITFLVLVILSIVCLTYINEYFFAFQLFCIIIIWPIIVFRTDTRGLINNKELINRSLLTDLKESFLTLKQKV